MAKTTNPQGNVWIQSDVPLSKDDKDTVLKKVQDVMQKKSNDDDDFLLKIITIEHEGKKGLATICPIKNDSEFINALRCVLQTFYTFNPTLTEAIASHFFVEEAPQMTPQKQGNLN